MTDSKKTINHSRPGAVSILFRPASKRSGDPQQADCRGDSQRTGHEKYKTNPISNQSLLCPQRPTSHGPRLTIYAKRTQFKNLHASRHKTYVLESTKIFQKNTKKRELFHLFYPPKAAFLLFSKLFRPHLRLSYNNLCKTNPI